MITDENNIPLDNEDEADDQMSQQDVQSDGIDPVLASEEDENASDIDLLQQADEASEASFTLNVDRGIAPEQSEKE
jgi:hypothetical protein